MTPFLNHCAITPPLTTTSSSSSSSSTKRSKRPRIALPASSPNTVQTNTPWPAVSKRLDLAKRSKNGCDVCVCAFIDGDSSCVQCSYCFFWFHFKCVGLTDESPEVQDNGPEWACGLCKLCPICHKSREYAQSIQRTDKRFMHSECAPRKRKKV